MGLPTGLRIDPTSGAITGRPETAAAVNGVATDYTFTVQATDANGLVSYYRDTIRVYPAPTVALTTPAGTVGVAYAGATTATGGSTPYAYSVSAGALPTSLSLNAGTGAITGTPSAAGVFTFTIRVTADKGSVVDTAGSITIT